MSRYVSLVSKKTIVIMMIIVSYILIPYGITMAVTGIVGDSGLEDVSEKYVTVSHDNSIEKVGLEEFVLMVLAKRMEYGDNKTLLMAESVMARTDILRKAEGKNNIDSDRLKIEFLTKNEMKNLWRLKFADNYELLKSCVGQTSGITLKNQGEYIDARYTAVSNGKTVSGEKIIGESYKYLKEVVCDRDLESGEYLKVYTFLNRDAALKFRESFPQINIGEENIYSSIKIIDRNYGGYVTRIQIGDVILTGEEFAGILNINSSCFTIDDMGKSIKITTTGKGEGLGVSLYTAGKMAEEGMDYKDILKVFYDADITE